MCDLYIIFLQYIQVCHYHSEPDTETVSGFNCSCLCTLSPPLCGYEAVIWFYSANNLTIALWIWIFDCVCLCVCSPDATPLWSPAPKASRHWTGTHAPPPNKTRWNPQSSLADLWRASKLTTVPPHSDGKNNTNGRKCFCELDSMHTKFHATVALF